MKIETESYVEHRTRSLQAPLTTFGEDGYAVEFVAGAGTSCFGCSSSSCGAVTHTG